MAAVLEPEWTLGDRLRKAREVAGLSRDEIALKIGATKASVWNGENDVSRPRDVLAVIHEWAEITGVNVDWLISRNRWGLWTASTPQALPLPA